MVGISFAYQRVVSFRETRKKILAETLSRVEAPPVEQKGLINSIELQSLVIRYDDKAVFAPISQYFQGGHKYLLKGSSGAGKTSILSALMKDLDEYEGSILINGSDLKAIGVNNQIGLMNDTPRFMNDTLRNNILLGSSIPDTSISEAMKSLNMEHLIARMDEKVDTANYEFSLGERKRIEFIRVFLRDFSVLLLDEPTSNIDRNSRDSLIEVLGGINDKLIICTSHDNAPDFLRLFDQVIEIGL